MLEKKFFLPTDIRFGAGAINSLKSIVSGVDTVFFVTDKGLEATGLADKVRGIIEETGASCVTYNDVEPNPTEELVEKALKALQSAKPSKVVALGGGSPADLGKILAALATNPLPLEDYQWNGKSFENPSLPFVCIPTTAGTGSEVTRVAVIVSRKAKKGINANVLYPKYAIIDPALMLGLPLYLTATTGMDALTHAIEAYTGLGANPFTDAWAEKAIKLIGKSFWVACANGGNVAARQDMALASTLAGIAMDQAGLGMVHAMSGPMCGFFHLAHGESNAILLEYVMQYNLMACPEKFANIAQFLGCETAGLDVFERAELSVAAVKRLFEKTGAKPNLANFGISCKHADIVAEETTKMFLLKNNPRVPSVQDCKDVFLKVLADYGIS